jgi:hypothetical protein
MTGKHTIGPILTLLTLGLFLYGCTVEVSGGGGKTNPVDAVITYSAMANGGSGANGSPSASSSRIDFVFSENVTGLAVSDIFVSGATKGTLSGSGRNWSLGVTPTSTAGTVSISKSGIESGTKSVIFYIYTPPPTYYDYAGIGVSFEAVNALNASGFYVETVYSGSQARMLLQIIADYPASNSADTLYERRTYSQLISWLDGFNLPHEIATRAADSITAYCYYDRNNNLWAVFAEDVSADYRSAESKSVLERRVTPRNGYPQTPAGNK